MKKESVLYTIPTSFFEENKFLENLARELKIMEGEFPSKEQKDAKNSFNAFFENCMNQSSKNNKYKVIILFYQTLINYAQFYRCTDTFDNLIEYFEGDIFLLLKAKKNVLKIYLHHIEDKNKLADVALTRSAIFSYT